MSCSSISSARQRASGGSPPTCSPSPGSPANLVPLPSRCSSSTPSRPAVDRFHDSHLATEVLLEASDDLPPVLCDETSLDQLVSNLLDNALKYAGNHPAEIFAVHEPARRVVCVDVADRCPGVSSDVLARIFEPFVRGSATRTYGLGLGLAVCERLVTALGGSISASPRAGGGAVFSFALPVLEE